MLGAHFSGDTSLVGVCVCLGTFAVGVLLLPRYYVVAVRTAGATDPAALSYVSIFPALIDGTALGIAQSVHLLCCLAQPPQVASIHLSDTSSYDIRGP